MEPVRFQSNLGVQLSRFPAISFLSNEGLSEEECAKLLRLKGDEVCFISFYDLFRKGRRTVYTIADTKSCICLTNKSSKNPPKCSKISFGSLKGEFGIVFHELLAAITTIGLYVRFLIFIINLAHFL